MKCPGQERPGTVLGGGGGRDGPGTEQGEPEGSGSV